MKIIYSFLILVLFIQIANSNIIYEINYCLNSSVFTTQYLNQTNSTNNETMAYSNIGCRYGCDMAAGVCRDIDDINFAYLALCIYILLIAGFFVLAWFFKSEYPILTVFLLFICLIFMLLALFQVIQAGEQFTGLNPQISTLQSLAYGLGFLTMFIFAIWILYLMRNSTKAIFTENDENYEEEF